MGADHITYCPMCLEHALREWIDLGWESTDHGIDLVMAYRCECRECLFEYNVQKNTLATLEGQNPMKVQMSGQALTKQEIKRTGNDKKVLESESQTTVIGPFSVDEVHAEVRASLRVTISENYHSASLECAVMIPTAANEDAAQAGFQWAHDFCTRNINEKMKRVRQGLRSLSQNS